MWKEGGQRGFVLAAMPIKIQQNTKIRQVQLHGMDNISHFRGLWHICKTGIYVMTEKV